MTFMLLIAATATAQVHLPMDRTREVTAVNMEPGRIDNGKLSGQATWDPYVWLLLPQEEIDARVQIGRAHV